MINDILVCLEGSPSSEAATRFAIELARERRATLVGMAIIDEPDIRAGAAAGIGGSSFKHERDKILLAKARAHAEDWLGLFQRRCRSEDVPASTLEIVGRPAEMILGEMERHDVTVMGRDANFRFETESEDSATRNKILRHANHPIFLVPESVTEVPANIGQTVLVAYDGSGAAEHALMSFAKSGLAESREVHVATVGDDGERAWDIATSAVERLRTLGIKAFTHNIVSLLPTPNALVALGSELGAGLMVMGAFARSRVAELFCGSDTRDLVEHSPMPLCLQH
jgi:nucleotide-binding universal stress UspA family protein